MKENGYMTRNLTNEIQLIKSFEETADSRIFRKVENRYEVQVTDNMESDDALRFYNLDGQVVKSINEENVKIIASQAIKANHLGCEKAPSKDEKFVFKYEIDVSINKWKTESFTEDKALFKLLIPNEKKIRFNDYFNICDSIGMNHSSGGRAATYFFNGIRFSFNKKDFYIYNLKQINSFVLETLSEISYEEFDNLQVKILAAFGFITGYVPLNYGYLFSYKESDSNFTGVMFSEFPRTYNGKFNLISLNPYNYGIREPYTFDNEELNKTEELKEIESKLEPVTKEVFSKLCLMMSEDSHFSNAIFSFLEVNDCNNRLSLLSMGALYSVVLETLTNIISKENEDKVSPIKDKKIAKSLVTSLIYLASGFFKEKKLGELSSTIKIRLENINSPTNQDKLSKSYEILGITITDEDKKTIKRRNDFLHGNDIESLGIDETFRIVLDFNYLVSALIFKRIGFTGIVKNLSTVYLGHKNLNTVDNTKSYKEI